MTTARTLLDTPTPEAYPCANWACGNRATVVEISEFVGPNGPTVAFYGRCADCLDGPR